MLIQHSTIKDVELDEEHERLLLSLPLERLGDYPADLVVPSPHFVVFLAMDATSVDDHEVLEFASRSLSQGAIWFCTWGPDCKRVHDLIDKARDQRFPDPTDDTIRMTTWHNDDELADALWFAIYSACPAEIYIESCRAVLFITVGSPIGAKQIGEWLSAPEVLNQQLGLSDEP